MDILNIFSSLFLSLFPAFRCIRIRCCKSTKSRIDQLANEGNKQALAARSVISNLDVYLSACQLGITITSLGLGWLGEPTVEHLLRPLFEKINITGTMANTLSFIIAFSVITFFHVVLGELVPKSFAIQKQKRLHLSLHDHLFYLIKLCTHSFGYLIVLLSFHKTTRFRTCERK